VIPLGRDTLPEAETVYLRLLRQAPPWRKMELATQMSLAVRTLAECGLRRRYPAAGPGEIHRRLACLLLGTDLSARIYGCFPGDGPPEPDGADDH